MTCEGSERGLAILGLDLEDRRYLRWLLFYDLKASISERVSGKLPTIRLRALTIFEAYIQRIQLAILGQIVMRNVWYHTSGGIGYIVRCQYVGATSSS